MAETAIVVVVPEAERAIERVRRRLAPDGTQSMPAHVTLLYPFADSESLVDARVGDVRKALVSFAPFEVELAEFERFERTLDAVLWLAPRPAEPFVALTTALAAAFPEHPPYGGEFRSIVPHLTVAVSDDRALLARIEADLSGRLPIAARVEEVAIYEHAAEGWRLLTPIPLHRRPGAR